MYKSSFGKLLKNQKLSTLKNHLELFYHHLIYPYTPTRILLLKNLYTYIMRHLRLKVLNT